MNEYIGIDIGGTKCAVVRGSDKGKILGKRKFSTRDRDSTLEELFDSVKGLWTEETRAIGVSCGGPLDSRRGVILGPPNLPGWEEVHIVRMLQERFGVPAYLANDADACAVAEWRFGAGRGCTNMIFLTFGTGLGAGLILNGKLYSGACGMAGEVGHIRLYPGGHTGYGKAGSFEGYVSGGGIAQYGLGDAASLADRAFQGDPQARRLWEQTGQDLGRLLALLTDLLNPEMIVIGSIYARAGIYMEAAMNRILQEEALEASRKACRIVPAALGESLGDMAALGIAMAGRETDGT